MELIDTFTHGFAALEKSPLPLFIAAFLLAVAQALRWWPKCPNWFAPASIMGFSTLLYPMLGDPLTFGTEGWRRYVMLTLAGFILGVLVAALHVAVLAMIFKWLQSKLPAGFLPADVETTKTTSNETDHTKPI